MMAQQTTDGRTPMIRMLANASAVAALALTMVACGNSEQRAPGTTASPPTATTATPTTTIAHGDALCDLIATHFGSLLTAHPGRQLYPSGDMCKVGGSTMGQPRAAQVRVVVASRTGMTPALLSSF